MPKSRPPYSPEFCRRMVDLVHAWRDPDELAREFELTGQSIRAWLAMAANRRCCSMCSAEGCSFARSLRSVQISASAIPALPGRPGGASGTSGVHSPIAWLSRDVGPGACPAVRRLAALVEVRPSVLRPTSSGHIRPSYPLGLYRLSGGWEMSR